MAILRTKFLALTILLLLRKIGGSFEQMKKLAAYGIPLILAPGVSSLTGYVYLRAAFYVLDKLYRCESTLFLWELVVFHDAGFIIILYTVPTPLVMRVMHALLIYMHYLNDSPTHCLCGKAIHRDKSLENAIKKQDTPSAKPPVSFSSTTTTTTTTSTTDGSSSNPDRDLQRDTSTYFWTRGPSPASSFHSSSTPSSQPASANLVRYYDDDDDDDDTYDELYGFYHSGYCKCHDRVQANAELRRRVLGAIEARVEAGRRKGVNLGTRRRAWLGGGKGTRKVTGTVF